MSKTMTLRLTDQQAHELAAIARVDDISMAEAVRDAIVEHVEARRRDPEFRARLRRFMDEEREVLERLAS